MKSITDWYLWVVVVILAGFVFIRDDSHNREEQKLRSNIDTLLTIDSLLIKQDSTLWAHLICRDTSIHAELALRDTSGVWAYNWIKYFSCEYPWIERQMKEDNKVVE